MKKAVLYARVSSARQEKEKTIDSQINELKKQITNNNDVLVKEYIDNGYSGAQLDRPAMNELRQDIKTDLFDTIYFLNTDRIAREVTYQTIIVAEILKYKKQIIINDKDYVHNPENKFALTILGAVSELERAKIIERSVRGKLHKLRQGQVLNNGSNIYGYNYLKRSPTCPAQLAINAKEAKVVKYIFAEYSKGASWRKLIAYLEDNEIKTKNGCTLWDTVRLRKILTNETYYGLRYFNKEHHFKKTDNPMHKIKYGKKIIRDRSEWIGVKVPAVIPKSLFDKVQQRFEANKNIYCKKPETQLLSGLVICGNCNRRFISYQRYYRYKVKAGQKIIHKVAYVCGRRVKNILHSKKVEKQLCKNPEVSARLLEPCVFKMIEDVMLKPDKLLPCTDYIKNQLNFTHQKLEKEINDLEDNISELKKEKKYLLDKYATGKITRTEYAKKCIQSDNDIDKLKTNKNKLIQSVPALHKKYVIEASVKQFCEIAKDRFEQSTNPETKRQFLLDYIEKVVYLNKKVTLCGSIPVKLKAYEDPNQPSESSRVRFHIEKELL